MLVRRVLGQESLLGVEATQLMAEELDCRAVCRSHEVADQRSRARP